MTHRDSDTVLYCILDTLLQIKIGTSKGKKNITRRGKQEQSTVRDGTIEQQCSAPSAPLMHLTVTRHMVLAPVINKLLHGAHGTMQQLV